MRDSELLRGIKSLAEMALELAKRSPHLLAKLDEGSGGYPSSTVAELGASHPVSSVETKAERQDPAARDREVLERAVQVAFGAVQDADRVARSWTCPRQHPCHGGCVACGERPAMRTTAKGALKEKACLCRPCREFAARVGRMPQRGEVRTVR